MQPLVETPDSNDEHQDLVELLLANGIRYQKKPSSFLMPATIWVEDDDHPKAIELASCVAARHAAHTKADRQRQWEVRYKGSYVRWLIANLHKRANVLRLLLLVMVFGIFVVYPAVYVIRRVL